MLLNRSVFTLMVAVVFASLAIGGDSGAEKLHGTWVGKFEGKSITMVFGPKNVVKIRIETDTEEGTFSVDWSKNPGHLDIDWGKQGKAKTIIELKDDKLKFEDVVPDKDRPKMFTKKAFSLKRDKVKQ
jgi:uncharacterized protein (TIGR03067 family)